MEEHVERYESGWVDEIWWYERDRARAHGYLLAALRPPHRRADTPRRYVRLQFSKEPNGYHAVLVGDDLNFLPSSMVCRNAAGGGVVRRKEAFSEVTVATCTVDLATCAVTDDVGVGSLELREVGIMDSMVERYCELAAAMVPSARR